MALDKAKEIVSSNSVVVFSGGDGVFCRGDGVFCRSDGNGILLPRRRRGRHPPPGLLDVVSAAGSEDATAASLGPSRAGSPAPGILSRTTSSLWTEVSRSPSMARTASSASSSSSADPDVDRRADAFIANFWRHIQMERQVSLELRYCKSNSLESSPASD